MFAIVVSFQIKSGKMDAFLPLMSANAAMSLAQEPGCQRFDVWTDSDAPNDVFLYEIYDNKSAFQAHLASAHFKTFDAEVADMIASKDVRSFATQVN